MADRPPNLVQLRHRVRCSESQLAERINSLAAADGHNTACNKNRISYWENGHCRPSPFYEYYYARALGVRADEPGPRQSTGMSGSWAAPRWMRSAWDRREGGVRWHRLSYRTGALVDLAAAIGMAFPGRLWPLRFAAQLQRGHAKL